MVGLGNPGAKYTGTRHNIGFEAIDYISEKTSAPITKAKFQGLYGTWQYKDKKIMLLKPQTYMNLSGQSVAEAAKFFKVPVQNIIVLHDDVSLPIGKLRIREKGSAGGHNGLKSIISYFDEDFLRIKIGVGEKPHPDYDLADWVLGKFTDEEKKQLEQRFDDILKAVEMVIDGETQQAMSRYSR